MKPRQPSAPSTRSAPGAKSSGFDEVVEPGRCGRVGIPIGASRVRDRTCLHPLWCRAPARRTTLVRHLPRPAGAGLRLRRAAPDADARAHRGRPADALALRRPAARRRARAERPAGRAVAARQRAASRRGARPARAAHQDRGREPDALVQGSRRLGRVREGARARPRGARVRVDGQPRRRRRGPGRGARARGLHLHPGRPRAREDHRGVGARRAHLRRRGQLRRREPPVRRARLRAAVGVRQLQRAPVLRAGLEDRRVRDGRAARLAPARPDDRADRLGLALHQDRSRLPRAARGGSRRG